MDQLLQSSLLRVNHQSLKAQRRSEILIIQQQHCWTEVIFAFYNFKDLNDVMQNNGRLTLLMLVGKHNTFLYYQIAEQDII